MAERITDKFLQAVCDRINRATGMPAKPWDRALGAERMTANIGNYHLSHAYGGVSLHRMHNQSGGASDVFGCGHVTKRELADRMFAFLCGIDFGKETAGAGQKMAV